VLGLTSHLEDSSRAIACLLGAPSHDSRHNYTSCRRQPRHNHRSSWPVHHRFPRFRGLKPCSIAFRSRFCLLALAAVVFFDFVPWGVETRTPPLTFVILTGILSPRNKVLDNRQVEVGVLHVLREAVDSHG